MPVISEFFIELARDKGLYDRPSEKSDAVMGVFHSIVSNDWFIWAAIALGGVTIGVWLDTLLRRAEHAPLIAQAKIDFKDLDADAERVAKGINELIGETTSRPPTHPKFDANPDLWQQENAERQESAMRQFHSKYAVDAFRIIDIARRYELVNKNEIWRVSHISFGYGLSEMAQLLSAISSRAREIDV